MSDLVKRLTIKAGVMEMGEKIAWGSDTSLMREAADRIEELCLLHREYEKLLRERIEELEAKLEAVTTVRELMGHMWGDAEDKLEKAIGALEKVQAFVRDLEPHADHGHTLAPALREACETLAELKGETDD